MIGAGGASGALPSWRVIVTWDGSREAVRAVYDAMPLIWRADNVIILSADAGKRRLRSGHHPEPEWPLTWEVTGSLPASNFR